MPFRRHAIPSPIVAHVAIPLRVIASHRLSAAMHSHVPRSHCVSIHSKLFRVCSVQIRADPCLSTAFLMIASPRRSFSWLCFAVPSLLIAKLISGVLCLRTALSIFANLIPCFSARLSPAPPYAIQFQCCVLPSKAPLPRSCASHCLACA